MKKITEIGEDDHRDFYEMLFVIPIGVNAREYVF